MAASRENVASPKQDNSKKMSCRCGKKKKKNWKEGVPPRYRHIECLCYYVALGGLMFGLDICHNYLQNVSYILHVSHGCQIAALPGYGN